MKFSAYLTDSCSKEICMYVNLRTSFFKNRFSHAVDSQIAHVTGSASALKRRRVNESNLSSGLLTVGGLQSVCNLKSVYRNLVSGDARNSLASTWSSKQVTFHRFFSSRLKISRVVPNTIDRPGAGAVWKCSKYRRFVRFSAPIVNIIRKFSRRIM